VAGAGAAAGAAAFGAAAARGDHDDEDDATSRLPAESLERMRADAGADGRTGTSQTGTSQTGTPQSAAIGTDAASQQAPAGQGAGPSGPPPHTPDGDGRGHPEQAAQAVGGNGSAAGHGGPPRGGPPPRAPQPEDENPDQATLDAVVTRVDEVLVIDEEPHFHLGRCGYLFGREVIPLPVSEALELGFAGCSWCEPVRGLAEQHADSRR
jgi:hypothetical protein